MEQNTNQQSDHNSAGRQPVVLPPNLNGDFAAGQRTLPKSTARPDYARGQRSQDPIVNGPDFARGVRTLPRALEVPDYARGLRQTSQ